MANIDFTLEIDGPSPVTYGPDTITVDRIEIEERVDRLRTEKSNVRVEATELFTWTTPDDVPPNETYRARLARENEAIFAGVLETRDITYTPERNAWDLLLTTDEVERLEASEVSFLESIAPGGRTGIYSGPKRYSVPSIVQSPNPDRRVKTVFVEVYAAHELMEHCLDQLVSEGIVASYTLPADPHPIETIDVWADGSENEMEAGLCVTPVNDDCYDNVIGLAELFGFRMTADYATYPTDALQLTFEALDNTTNAQSLPTNRNERDVIELDNIDAGLRLSGAEQDAPFPESAKLGGSDKETYYTASHIPAGRGVGVTEWNVEASNPTRLTNFVRQFPREFKTDLTTLTYAPCPVSVTEFFTQGPSDPELNSSQATNILAAGVALIEDSPADVQTDVNTAIAPGLTFDVLFVEAADWPRAADEVYVMHSRQDPGDQGDFVDGTTGSATSPTWIETAYNNTAELRGFQKRLEASVQGRIGLDTIGDWHIERSRYDVDTGYSQIDAVSIVTTPRDYPQADVSSDTFAVQNVRGRYIAKSGSGTANDWIQLWWSRPPLRFDRTFWYEVEMKSIDNPSVTGPNIDRPSGFGRNIWYYAIPPQGEFPSAIGNPGPLGPAEPFWQRRWHGNSMAIINPFDDSLQNRALDVGKVRVRITPYAETGEAGEPFEGDLRTIWNITNPVV